MEPVTIQRQVDLGISASELWGLIADPQQLAVWLGDAADVDLRPGGRGVILDDGVRRELLVERVDEGHSLAFTWWEADDPASASRVTFEIDGDDADGGSRLNITETMSASIAMTETEATAARQRWEVRVLSLWACTVAAALAE